MTDDDDSGTVAQGISLSDIEDFDELRVELEQRHLESLNNGGGVTWDVSDDELPVDGVYVTSDADGFGEYAFRKHVERQHSPVAYWLDYGGRFLTTPAFWARVAVYAIVFVSAPFVVTALGSTAAVGFVYGVIMMLGLPLLLKASPLPDPEEAAKHD